MIFFFLFSFLFFLELFFVILEAKKKHTIFGSIQLKTRFIQSYIIMVKKNTKAEEE